MERFATLARSIWSRHGFAVCGLLSLAIATHTTSLAVVNAVVWSSLPYRDVSNVVRVSKLSPEGRPVTFDREFVAWAQGASEIATLAAYKAADRLVASGTAAERIRVAHVTEGFSKIVAVSSVDPLPGSSGDPKDDGVIISARLARRLFGGERVVGNPVTIDAIPYVVSGVTPTSLVLPDRREADALVELRFGASASKDAGVTFVNNIIARLRPGHERRELRDRLQTIDGPVVSLASAQVARLAEGGLIAVVPLLEDSTKSIRRPLAALVAAVSILWVVACLNAASLQLARVRANRDATSLKIALGASWWRLAREICAEVSLLGAASAVFGAAIARWLIQPLPQLLEGVGVRAPQLTMDGVALGYAIASAIGATILVSMWPLVHVRHWLRHSIGPLNNNRNTAPPSKWIPMLMGMQIGLAALLVVMSVALTRSIANLNSIPLGFDPRNLVRSQVALPSGAAGRPALTPTILIDGLSRSGALGTVAVGTTAPLFGPSVLVAASLPASVTPGLTLDVGLDRVSRDYFSVAGTRLISGRYFENSVGEGPVAIVNVAFVQRFGLNGRAAGSEVVAGDERLQIVGVVEDAKDFDITASPGPRIYTPFGTSAEPVVFVLARSPLGRIATWEEALRTSLRFIDARAAVYEVAFVNDDVREATALVRLMAQAAALLGGLTLFIAISALVSFASYLTRLRRKEDAIRKALGATNAQLVMPLLRNTVLVALVGSAAGAAVSTSLLRLLDDQLYGVADAQAYIIGGCVIFLTVIIAVAVIPSLVAVTTANPIHALRQD